MSNNVIVAQLTNPSSDTWVSNCFIKQPVLQINLISDTKIMNKFISIIILLGTGNIAAATEQQAFYNWTGAYAGLNLGAVWTDSQNDQLC